MRRVHRAWPCNRESEVKALRFVVKSAVLGLAIFALYVLFWPKQLHMQVHPVPDYKHNVMCYVTDVGQISCLNMVLNT